MSAKGTGRKGRRVGGGRVGGREREGLFRFGGTRVVSGSPRIAEVRAELAEGGVGWRDVGVT